MANDLPGCLHGVESIVLASLFQRRWVTVVSLVLLVWDYFITIGDEIRHIWRYPLNSMKATYILTRYVPLAMQSVNLYLVHGPLYAGVSIEDRETCDRWWRHLVATASILLLSLDFVLMLRVYALYQKNKKIGYLLVSMFMTLFVNQVIKHVTLLDALSFNCICDAEDKHFQALYFCIDVFIVQLVIGALLLAKRQNLRSIGSQALKVVNRDGALLTGLMCALFSGSFAYSSARRTYQPHLIMILPISLISVACCRTILNLLTIRVGEELRRHSDSEESIVLTTVFSNGE